MKEPERKNLKDEASHLQDAIMQVLNTLGVTEENDPRLRKAKIIYAGGDSCDYIAQVEEALQRDPALPVIITGSLGLPQTVARNPQITALLHFPNVRFVNAFDDQAIVELLYTFKKPKTASIHPDDRGAIYEALRGSFRHDLRHALQGDSGYNQGAIVGKARKQLDLQGDDETVIRIVMAPKQETPDIPAYFNCPAVCVDWEGTLFQQGSFSKDIFTRAEQIAHEENAPLIIWTGGDVNAVYQELRRLGMNGINVCSKHDCRGLRLKMAIDDEDPEFLRKEYGFDAEQFQKV